ncbi:MAG: arsenate reductase family protein [Ruminococcus sp.]|nr:arsenate reductase family protein [Ruminococcus sp.]MDE6785329.1 arsenate reductase family protein [Ruminococcus sp.]
MNIQIFGTKKCSDTRKAERYFKERGIKYQFIDMKEKGMSRGEFNSIIQAAGSIDEIINENAKDKQTLVLMRYLSESDRTEKLFENQQLIRTPIVRNGRKASVGYCPDVWKDYIE